MSQVGSNGAVTEEKRLGEVVQLARKHAGLTQQALCQRSGLSYSTLAKIERGAIKAPSVFTIQQIAATVGVSLDELLQGITAATSPPVVVSNKKVSQTGIRFVYFDLNGCLIRFAGHHGLTKLAEDSLQPPEVIETVFWQYDPDVCRGEKDISELNRALSERLDMTVDWKNYYLAGADPTPGIDELVTWVAENYYVGILSNTMPGFIDSLEEHHLIPPVHYDTIIQSSVVHALKPEPAIFEAATRQAGVEPHEILLIDNERSNLATASKFGWHTMRFDTYHPEESIVAIATTLQPAE